MPLEVWILFVALAAPPLLWAGTCWLIGQVGWARLAARFPAEAAPADAAPVRTLRFVSGRLGLATYNGVLTVGLRPDGLRLSVFVLFRPGHAPAFVPWDAITSAEPSRLLWTKQVRLRIGTPHVATLTLPARVVDAMREVADVG